MEIIGKICIFAGFLTAISCQLYIAYLAFQKEFLQGLLCFIVPGYLLAWAAWREETRQPKVLFIWGGSIVLIILGVIVLS